MPSFLTSFSSGRYFFTKLLVFCCFSWCSLVLRGLPKTTQSQSFSHCSRVRFTPYARKNTKHEDIFNSIDQNILMHIGASILEESAMLWEKFPVRGLLLASKALKCREQLRFRTISGVPLLLLCYSDENHLL